MGIIREEVVGGMGNIRGGSYPVGICLESTMHYATFHIVPTALFALTVGGNQSNAEMKGRWFGLRQRLKMLRSVL